MKLSQLALLASIPFSLCTFAHSEEMKPTSEAPRTRVNYPSNFQVESGWDFFIAGEYLLWSASEDGLYFAQTGFEDSALSTPLDGVVFDGKLKKIHPGWDNGLRIGAGLNFPREGYDAIVYWTWFSSTAHKSAHGSLMPLWAEPSFFGFTPATQASGKWDLNLNTVDLEWGRSSWFGGHFSMRPFFGFRGAMIEQDLRSHFTYAITPTVKSRQHSNADFKGIGLRAGVDVRFALPLGFGVYGMTSGSLLYGQFNDNFRSQVDEFTVARTKDRFKRGISSLQLGFGFSWDSHFHKDRLHVEFHVGCESNIWFSINQMNHFMNQLGTGNYFKENGNLSMQGLVAGGRFDF